MQITITVVVYRLHNYGIDGASSVPQDSFDKVQFDRADLAVTSLGTS